MSENLEAYTSMPAPELARLLGPTEDEAESTRRTASATMEVPASEDEPDEEETGSVPSEDRQEPAP
jgi:hypothetical protein